LKACIAKLMKSEEFPDRTFAEKCWTHNLTQLLGLAGLKDAFDAAIAADPDLLVKWEIVRDWNEVSRYARKTKADAEELFDAITDKKHGCSHGSGYVGRHANTRRAALYRSSRRRGGRRPSRQLD
jgi:hypothetical protein